MKELHKESPIKVITSNNIPTSLELDKGDIGFGKINDKIQVYGNNGTEILLLNSYPENSVLSLEVRIILPIQYNAFEALKLAGELDPETLYLVY